MLVPVILSGGSGTRLWPLSRELHPKQFLPLVGDRTMLQDTVLRLEGIESGPPIVVCNAHHRFLVAEQLRVAVGELLIQLAERGDFGGAHEGEVHRPEEVDLPLARVACIRDRLELFTLFQAHRGHDGKGGEFISNSKHDDCCLLCGF